MARHIVCLTFDFDAMSLWMVRKMTTPTAISRGEFGAVGARRILSLLQKNGIKGTWYVPGHTLETYPEICSEIHRSGHEIGSHGYMHEPPATVSKEEEASILKRSKVLIAKLTGAPPKGYRSPSWDLSPHTVDLLLAEGFDYDSSMMADDYTPYFARRGDVIPPDRPAIFGETTNLIEIAPSWSLDDFPAFEYLRMPNYLQGGLRRTSDVLENWLDDYEFMRQNLQWGVMSITFHPQVSGRGHRMLMMERLIDQLGERGAVFMRMDEAAQEFRVRGQGG